MRGWRIKGGIQRATRLKERRVEGMGPWIPREAPFAAVLKAADALTVAKVEPSATVFHHHVHDADVDGDRPT